MSNKQRNLWYHASFGLHLNFGMSFAAWFGRPNWQKSLAARTTAIPQLADPSVPATDD